MRNDEYLRDQDMLLDLLVTSKYMSHLYDHCVLEASHGDIKDMFEQLQQEEHDTADVLFATLKENRWYNSRYSGMASRKSHPYYADELEKS